MTRQFVHLVDPVDVHVELDFRTLACDLVGLGFVVPINALQGAGDVRLGPRLAFVLTAAVSATAFLEILLRILVVADRTGEGELIR